MTVLPALLLLALAPALAQDPEGDAVDLPDWLSDDDEAPIQVDERPLWPQEVRIDTKDGIISIDWFGDGRPPEWFALEDLDRFERARPWEGQPDELFIVLTDGTRVLAASGSEVSSQAVLAPALADKPIKELAPGQGHLTPASMAARPGPALSVGRLGGGMAIKALSTSATEGDTQVALKDAQDERQEADGEGGGTLDRREIDAEFRRRTNIFGRCYQQGLQRRPTLSGTVTLQLVIDLDGSVKGAWVEDSSLGDATVEHCILEEVRQARFPAPEGGTVVVSYPLKF